MTGKRLIATLLLGALVLLSVNLPAEPPPSDAIDEPSDAEYVTVSLDTVPSTDGKALMLGAYEVIFGLFLAYGASLVWRERSVARRAARLKQQLTKR